MPVDTNVYKKGTRHWLMVGTAADRNFMVEYDIKLRNSIPVFSETVNLGSYKVVGTTSRGIAELAKFRLPRELYMLCNVEG